ncbi:MAG: dihydroorotase [Bdellovibrionales bacterium RBG_16_40_8]|nr:MAG: dihydroorotase [Bdellovibrionales bacterium RBG_16_40_8]
MSQHADLLIQGATIIAPDPKTQALQEQVADVYVHEKRIVHIGGGYSGAAQKILKAHGLFLLPGTIDTQVHFRDPGSPEKETLMSGTRAAVYGGVTSIFDMPNTNPPTLSAIDISDKMSRADGKTWCNYAFYVGASPTNADRLSELEKLPGVCGVKMFMGSSTGNLVVDDDDTLKKIIKNVKRRMAVHAEDNTRLTERKKIVLENPGHVELHSEWRDEKTAIIATKKLLHYARAANCKVHVLHITTAEEVEILAKFKDIATFEITPQHLTLFAPDCYKKLGTLAQMNPPIRERRHYEALWQAVTSGQVDIIGSDHAPHTLAEKNKTYPDTPSGMPGVQTILPLMIHHYLSGKISLAKVVELLSRNPAKIFGIKDKGEIKKHYDADLVLIDLKAKKEIKNSWIQSTCGWTPYDGMVLNGSIIATLVGGEVTMRDDQILGRPLGRPLSFDLSELYM